MCLALYEKERTNQHYHEQAGRNHAEATSPRSLLGTAGANLLRIPGTRPCLLHVEWRVVLLCALVIVLRAVTVCQQALAYACEMLSSLGLHAVHATEIVDETLISLIRPFFRKQLIKICHNTLPFYCFS